MPRITRRDFFGAAGADPGYTRAKSEMKSRLADWLIESEDPALPPVRAQMA